MKKSKINYYLILFLIFIIFIFLFLNINKEGFYTSDNITSASTKLNDTLSNNLEQLKTVISDINNQKYQLSISEVVNILNSEYGPDTKLNLPENEVTNNYIKQQIKIINNIQYNLNEINKIIDHLFEYSKINIKEVDSDITTSYSLLDAINKISKDVKNASNALSQIPP
jgi:hypothetical protein